MIIASRSSALLAVPVLLLAACGGGPAAPHTSPRGGVAAAAGGATASAAPGVLGGGGENSAAVPGSPSPAAGAAGGGGGGASAVVAPGGGGSHAGAASSPPTRASAAASPPPGGCPDPRTCPDYGTLPDDARWPVDASGHAVVHYRVNPSHAGTPTSLSDAQVVTAVDRLAAMWHAVDPSISFVDDGTTSAQPVDFNDVVGFSAAAANAAVNIPVGVSSDGRTITGFDIQLAPSATWLWQPCDGEATPCAPYAGSGLDLGSTLAHAWGHAIGLADLGAAQDGLLTNSGGIGNGPDCGSNGYVCRFAVTPGLGDVLGTRHLYPTSAAMPAIPFDE